MATKIQVRRDSSADWTTINPVLSEGEIGFETNTGKFKIGNGSSAWSALDYFLDSSDLSAYLTASSASTTYLTQASASTTYLTQTSASSTYPTIGTLNSGLVSASAAAVAYLVDSAPGALDTLNELAAAINDDSSYATTVTNALASKASLSGTETLTNKTISGGTVNATTLQQGGVGVARISGGSLITISSSAPTGGSNGDIWLVY
jgi:hypothetical protein